MKKQEINRLWVLVNKFRGAFDATELYKIMLYALLFKYLELKKDEIDFYDEKIFLRISITDIWKNDLFWKFGRIFNRSRKFL